MKRILALVLTFAMLLSICGVATVAEDASVSADGLVLQDLSYDEILYRVSQGDTGFTRSSTAIYVHHMEETAEPRNDSGFQFYYISLSKYSGNFGDFEDAPIEQWFLDYLDQSLANLRANGGGCMIRATYGLDGQQKCEPTDFNVLLGHVKQLASVFTKYPDVISSVECGMIGAFGEMWGGVYSDGESKRQVLETWLENLDEDISVNVRTAYEYYNYVNSSDIFQSKYAGKTVNGVTYPTALSYVNYGAYSFPGEVFERIGIYNDAMLQDGNDGGTFGWSEDANIQTKLLANRAEFFANQYKTTNYGGEMSGETSDVYRYKLAYWMPLNAIPTLFASHLSYYHGGNAAYKNLYRNSQTLTKYWSDSLAEGRLGTLAQNIADAGLGMTYSSELNNNKCVVQYSDGTLSDVMTYDEAVALAEGVTGAVVLIGRDVTTGGWVSATASEELFAAIAEKVDVTADIDDYLGQNVAKYFEDHVGYRIVMRESYISDEVVSGGHIRVKGSVDNTGFANITEDKVTELVITNGTDTYVVATDIDAKSWDSAKRTGYDAYAVLPEGIAAGEYSVYMRVANQDPDGNTVAASAIAFANAGEYSYTTLSSDYGVGEVTFDSCYSSDVNGNYIGTVTVVDGKYEVAFADEDGTILQSELLESGVTPVYNGEEPAKKGEDARYYVFTGWDKEIVAVTANATYTATYKKLNINPGDVDGNEVLNIVDMTLTARYVAQDGASGKFDLSQCYIEMMDANKDGKIDLLDINYIAGAIKAQ